LAVDFRWLVYAHPLFARFDPLTHRFRGTSSEPVEGGIEGIRLLAANILEMQRQLEDFAKTWAPRMLACPAHKLQALQQTYLKERKTLEERLAIQKTRLEVAHEVPGRPGLTDHSSITPQVGDIVRDIQRVVLQLQKNHQASLVIDVSGLDQGGRASPDLLLLKERPLSHLGKPTFQKDRAMRWLLNAKICLWNRIPDLSPAVFGCRDARADAVDLLQSTTRSQP